MKEDLPWNRCCSRPGKSPSYSGWGDQRCLRCWPSGSCRSSGLGDRYGYRARPSKAGSPSTRSTLAEAGVSVPSSRRLRIGMTSLVPALPRFREVFTESRLWAPAGRHAWRRLERRPEKRRTFERGSTVKFSRKCSSIFLISNRPSATSSLVRTRPPRGRAGRWSDGPH